MPVEFLTCVDSLNRCKSDVDSAYALLDDCESMVDAWVCRAKCLQDYGNCELPGLSCSLGCPKPYEE